MSDNQRTISKTAYWKKPVEPLVESKAPQKPVMRPARREPYFIDLVPARFRNRTTTVGYRSSAKWGD